MTQPPNSLMKPRSVGFEQSENKLLSTVSQLHIAKAVGRYKETTKKLNTGLFQCLLPRLIFISSLASHRTLTFSNMGFIFITTLFSIFSMIIIVPANCSSQIHLLHRHNHAGVRSWCDTCQNCAQRRNLYVSPSHRHEYKVLIYT